VLAAISDCRSLLELPIYTTCKFAMTECRRFTVGMLIVYVIVSEILVLPVSWLPSWTFIDTRYSVGGAAMTARHLDVSYVVINPCIGFGRTCVSIKPAKLLVLPVITILNF